MDIFAVSFLSLFAAAGLACAGAGVYLEWRAAAFRRAALPTTGKVTSKWRSSSYKSESETKYLVEYQFATPSGETLRNHDCVTYWWWHDAAPGRPVRVYYMPGSPHWNALGAPRIDWNGVIWLVVGCVFCLVGIGGGTIVLRDILGRR
jgi:hypothetical protein